MQKKISFVLIMLFSMLITSCGFRLQGEMQLAPPLRRLYLQTPDPYGALARNLQTYFKMSDVQLVDSPELASSVLVILKDATSQVLLGVSATNQTRQYNLFVTVSFMITDARGRIIVPAQTLADSRTITIQSNQILGSSNEANMYYQQMRRSLAYAMMNRLSSNEITLLMNTSFDKADKS